MNKRKRSSNASSSEPTSSTAKRVIHIRDDNDEQDEAIESHSEIILNMSQAAKQDIVYSQPRILLKRVYFEQWETYFVFVVK